VASQIANAGNSRTATNGVDGIEPFTAVHAVIGVFAVPLTILALVAFSLGARHPRRTTILAALLFLLWVVQFGLAYVGFLGAAPLAGLHGINALAMVGLGVYLVKANWAY
jgi:heme A synthase